MPQHILRSSMLQILMVIPLFSGCAAIHPIKGIPVSQVPQEYLSMTRSDKHTISHSLLTQPVPPEHIVDRGDVLGIYIEGVLGNTGESPPVNFPSTPEGNPTIGYPLQVRDDGTISMPLYGSVNVKGMTLRQVEEHLREFYINKGILSKGREKIIVTLQKSRTVRVLVLRQEAQQQGGANELQQQGGFNLGQLKQGSGKTVYLPAYQNDVLHALAETGGLPGLDAENAVYIIRNTHNQASAKSEQMPQYIHGTPLIPNPPTMPPQYGMPYSQPQYMPQQSYPQHMPAYPLPGYGYKSSDNLHHKVTLGGLEVLNESSSNSKAPWKLLNVNAPVEYAQARGWNRQPETPTSWEQSVQQASYYNNYPYSYAAQQRGVIPDAVTPVTPPHLPAPVFEQRGSDMGATLNQFDKIDKMQIDLSKDPYYNIDRAPHGNLPPAKFDHQPLSTDLNQFTPIMQGPPTSSSTMSLMHNPPQHTTNQPTSPVQQYSPMNQGYSPTQQVMPGMQYAPLTPQPYAQMQHPQVQHQNMQPENAEQYQEGHQIETINPYDLPPNVIRIPIRLYPGEQIQLKPEDVILNDGDIVFIESRQTEIYYTAGLLGGGQYTLPRDYDLDILGAISIAQSAQNLTSGNTRAIGGVSAINGDVTISASNVIILRKTPEGGQIAIKIDLYKAINDPNERILIMPEDVVMLRYKCGEGVAAFVERNLLEGALFGVAAAQLQTGGGGN